MSGIPFPNISPELFSIDIAGFHLALRWYALAYIVGILLGWQIARVALGRDALWPGGKAPMSRQQLESLMTWLILGIILGGRLGYVLFYQPGQYLSDPLSIIRVWEGGMSFHGGFAGVVIAILLFCRSQKIALGPVSDMIAMATPPGLLLGRLANFINAELWGRPTDLPWGVIFPGAQAQDCGQLAATLCARHPSQLYEAALEGLILGAVLLWLAFRRGALQRPWLISGLFFSGYGLARFVVEFVRQPDAQFVSPGNPLGLALQAGDLGLTMGQILSLPMIVIGIVVAIRAWRRG